MFYSDPLRVRGRWQCDGTETWRLRLYGECRGGVCARIGVSLWTWFQLQPVACPSHCQTQLGPLPEWWPLLVRWDQGAKPADSVGWYLRCRVRTVVPHQQHCLEMRVKCVCLPGQPRSRTPSMAQEVDSSEVPRDGRTHRYPNEIAYIGASKDACTYDWTEIVVAYSDFVDHITSILVPFDPHADLETRLEALAAAEVLSFPCCHTICLMKANAFILRFGLLIDIHV